MSTTNDVQGTNGGAQQTKEGPSIAVPKKQEIENKLKKEDILPDRKSPKPSDMMSAQAYA